jgi:hypothetical protein
MATPEMLSRLPKLDDDDDIGVEKNHVVICDGYPDISFKGTLLASVAPENRGQERWREYRVYRTVGQQYVFSKVGRSMLSDERDKFEALVWKPKRAVEPGQFQTIVPVDLFAPLETQLASALADYFKYDALAKQLYARLRINMTRQIE